MFISLKSGAMLNLFWLQDCFQGKHDKNIVIFYLVNGVKLIEEYDSEAEAETRTNAVSDIMATASTGGGGVTPDLKNYYNKQQIDEMFKQYYKKEEIDELLKWKEY